MAAFDGCCYLGNFFRYVKKGNYFSPPGCISIKEQGADAQRPVHPNNPFQKQLF